MKALALLLLLLLTACVRESADAIGTPQQSCLCPQVVPPLCRQGSHIEGVNISLPGCATPCSAPRCVADVAADGDSCTCPEIMLPNCEPARRVIGVNYTMPGCSTPCVRPECASK